MRFTSFIKRAILLGGLLSFAPQPTVEAQDKLLRLSFEFVDTPLREAFIGLMDKHGISVIYQDDDVKGDSITAACNNCTVDEAMNRILHGTCLEWQRDGEIIIIRKKLGAIYGLVRDKSSQAHLPNANVIILGTNCGTATDATGHFRFSNMHPDIYILTVRHIGYKPDTLKVRVNNCERVAAEPAALDPILIELDAVTIDAKKGKQPNNQNGAAVETIDPQNRKHAPINNFLEMTKGHAPGIDISPLGTIGDGFRARLRAYNHYFKNKLPVIYIDGVRTAAGFVDIDPEIIERIEVLKGPAAAATRFGLQSTIGVILISTKKGYPEKPQFDLKVEQHFLTYPDVYKPNAGFARGQWQAERMTKALGFRVRPWEVVEMPYANNLFGTGYGKTYSLSTRGGLSGINYAAGGRFQQLDGPFDLQSENFNDFLKQVQVFTNINTQLSSKLGLDGSIIYNDNKQQLPYYRSSDESSFFDPVSWALSIKPEQFDENDLRESTLQRMRNFATNENPKKNVKRALGRLSANYALTNSIGLHATFGLDAVRQHGFPLYNLSTINGPEPITMLKETTKSWTTDLHAKWKTGLSDIISSSFVLGFQNFNLTTDGNANNDLYYTLFHFGDLFLDVIAGNDTPRHEVTPSIDHYTDRGLFLHGQINFKTFLELTAGIRYARILYDKQNSTGRQIDPQWHKQLGISFIPTSAIPGLTGSFLSNLRLKAAIGSTGQKSKTVNFSTNGLPIDVEPLRPGAFTEYEFGFDSSLLDDRLGFDLTFWRSTRGSAAGLMPFETGGIVLGRSGERSWSMVERSMNFKAKGFELAAHFTAIKKESFSFNMFANAAYMQESVQPDSLGGIHPFFLLFGGNLDKSIDFPIDVNNDGKADNKNELLAFFSEPRDPATFEPVRLPNRYDNLIKPMPDWTGAFGTKITFLKRFLLSTFLEFKTGNYFAYNQVRFSRHSARNTPEAAATELVLLHPESTAEQRLEAANKWVREFFQWSDRTGYLNTYEKADFLRWTEFSLAYDVPENFVAKFGLRTATVSIAGRNLALFTGYSGVDPELASLANEGAYDYYPLPRQFTLTLRAGF